MIAGRRATLVVLGLGVLLGAPAAAQPPERVHRVGLLDYGAPDAVRQNRWDVLRRQLRELGYLDGRNISFDLRWAEGDSERLPGLAAELVGLKVDVIVTGATLATAAAMRATSTIPIVAATGSDPVALGYVGSLRRPGGNVTGLTSISNELYGKRLELIRLVVPRASRVAILSDARNPASRLAVQETETAARTLGLTVVSVSVRTPAELDPAFARIARERAEALVMTTSPLFAAQRRRLADLAIRHRLPTIVGDRAYIDAGLLVAYGPDYQDLYRRAATFVDKILKGAKPGDLPIEQPTKFELIINLKTARALDLTIAPLLLQRADTVIQ